MNKKKQSGLALTRICYGATAYSFFWNNCFSSTYH